MQFHEVLKQAIDLGFKIRKTCWDSDQYLEYNTSTKELVTRSGTPTHITVEECLKADWDVYIVKRTAFGLLPTGTKFKFDDYYPVLTKVIPYNAINKTTAHTCNIEDGRMVVVVE